MNYKSVLAPTSMAIITPREIFDLIILVIALGYIFSGFVKKPKDILEQYAKKFSWDDVWYAAMVVSPAVILHELAHKGVGLFFGFDSVVHISVFGLLLGAGLRYFKSPIVFFVPAFVSSTAAHSMPTQFAVLALAGPATNFALYWISEFLFISRKWPKWNHAFIVSKQVNLWLFILNMIPIGIFDGAKVLAGSPTLYIGFAVLSGFLIYRNEKKWKRYVSSLKRW